MQPRAAARGGLGLRVFISYRHEDSQSYARELYQEVSNRLPGGQIFWDFDVSQLTEVLKQIKPKPLEPPTGRPPATADAEAGAASRSFMTPGVRAAAPADSAGSGRRTPLLIGAVVAVVAMIAAAAVLG